MISNITFWYNKSSTNKEREAIYQTKNEKWGIETIFETIK